MVAIPPRLRVPIMIGIVILIGVVLFFSGVFRKRDTRRIPDGRGFIDVGEDLALGYMVKTEKDTYWDGEPFEHVNFAVGGTLKVQ